MLFSLILIIDYLAYLKTQLHKLETKYKLASFEYFTLQWRSYLEVFYSKTDENSQVADILNSTSGLQLEDFMSKKFEDPDVDQHLKSQRLQKEEKARKILLNDVH